MRNSEFVYDQDGTGCVGFDPRWLAKIEDRARDMARDVRKVESREDPDLVVTVQPMSIENPLYTGPPERQSDTSLLTGDITQETHKITPCHLGQLGWRVLDRKERDSAKHRHRFK
jgi:hypothetical protein